MEPDDQLHGLTRRQRCFVHVEQSGLVFPPTPLTTCRLEQEEEEEREEEANPAWRRRDSGRVGVRPQGRQDIPRQAANRLARPHYTQARPPRPLYERARAPADRPKFDSRATPPMAMLACSSDFGTSGSLAPRGMLARRASRSPRRPCSLRSPARGGRRWRSCCGAPPRACDGHWCRDLCRAARTREPSIRFIGGSSLLPEHWPEKRPNNAPGPCLHELRTLEQVSEGVRTHTRLRA